MTALSEYQRLECTGLWRDGAEAQRREVFVSLGDATLTLSDHTDRALAHWSLAAVRRLNPGEQPALFAPGPDQDEELEIAEPEVIAALEKVRRAIDKTRPRRGRLRHVLTAGFLAGIAALAVFWLPGALVTYTAGVVPAATRAAIGERLAQRITRIAGRACDDPLGVAALGRLAAHVLGSGDAARLVVLSDATRPATHLPGGVILLSRALVEGQSGPEAVAGFVLAEQARAAAQDPMRRLLAAVGPWATFRLLTTGDMADPVLDTYAETLLTTPPAPLETEALLTRFRAIGLPASPYAYALDATGEATLALIEADPVKPWAAVSPLSDDDWISLQGICVE